MYEGISVINNNNEELQDIIKNYFDELMLMVNITCRYSFDSSYFVEDENLNVIVTVNSIDDREMLVEVLKHNNISYNENFSIIYNYVDGTNIHVTVSKTV